MSALHKSFGERLVAILQQEGVESIFSQGDLSDKDILKHAELAGLNIIAPRHEAAGVFMAMGQYHMTGRPQVAFGAIGPGVANLLPAAVTAAQEFIPVVLLGARRQAASDRTVRRGRWLHAPMFDMFARICKFAAKIDSPELLDEIVQEAFRKALSGTPGPVYIEYDFAMHSEPHDYGALLPPHRYRAKPRGVDEVSLSAAVTAISNAERVVVLAGEGIHRHRCHGALMTLVELLSAPIMTTFGGSGAIPETDPHQVLLQSQAGKTAIADSDLILAVGTCFPEMANFGCQRAFVEAFGTSRNVVAIEPDEAAVGVNRPVDYPLIGNVEIVLDQLIASLKRVEALPSHPDLPALRESWLDERRALEGAIPLTNAIHPSRLMLEARGAVPDDSIIVLDGGLTILYQLAHFEKRSVDFLYTANFSHLGTGLGLAIGAQIAAGRDRPVCLLTGDAALGFHFMEFETAIRHNLPIVVIINDDQQFGAEMAEHMQHIGHQIEVSLSALRYDDIARAMGGHGEFVTNVEDVAPAVQRAFASGKPALVQVKTEQSASHAHAPPYIDELVAWLMEDPSSYQGRRKNE